MTTTPCCPRLSAEIRDLGYLARFALQQDPVDLDLLREVRDRALALGAGDGGGVDLLADCR